MLIVPLGGSQSEERTSSPSAEARAATNSAKRSAVPQLDRLLLAGLLLVVAGWIVLRLLQMLFAAS
jgi:hypothetical protein